MFNNLSLRTKIVTSSLIPLVLVIILSIVSWSGVGTLLQSSEWVTHTHEVIGEAHLLESVAVDMETGMRGYLLAGKEEFLEPYIAGKARYEEITEKLKQTVSDNPQQVQLLDEAYKTIKDWIANDVEPSVALRRKIGNARTMDDLKAIISEGKGKEYFDKTREFLAQFAAREKKLLEERKANALKAAEDNAKIEQTLAESELKVEHSYKVIAKAKHIEALASDMETGLRGYLITGKEEFLAPYKAGKQSFTDVLKELSETVSDNSEQVGLLADVQANMNAWISDIAVAGIEMRDKVGTELKMDDIANMEGLTKGKVYFDKFRSQMATFTERESNLMSNRKELTNKLKEEKDANVELINKTTAWVEHTDNVLAELKEVELSAVNMETGLRGFLLTGTEGYLEPYQKGKEYFESQITSLSEKVSDNPAQVKLLTDIKNTINQWQTEVVDSEIALRTEIGNAETMNDIARLVGQGKGKVYFDKFRGQIATFVERETSLLESRNEISNSTASNVKLYILAGTALTILLNMIISFFVSGSIARPVTRAIEVLGSIASQVADAASQVSSSSQSLASGVTEQAAGLEESSSSLEEIATVTQNSLGDAKNASELAEEAQISANDGLAAMEKMNAAIQDIHKSSDETAKIIKVIDEIAFQTNLLALNAAVEAARAGEAGKGFAVVAEEVRNLAMRSAEAAKDTSSMIDNSVANSNRGVEIANEVSSALNTIAQKISNTFDLVKNIATSSVEQSEGINQISKAVSQMDSITQSNSANAEESASASEELYSQADQMKNTINELNIIINGISKSVSMETANSDGDFNDVYHDIASGKMGKEKKRVTSRERSEL